MADKADEFLKKLEAGDIMYYEIPEKERKKTLELLTSPENIKKTLDTLVAAAKSKKIDARESAASILDEIGEKKAMKAIEEVAKFWMPFLDMEYGGKVIGGVPAFDAFEQFNRRQAVEVFERLRWPPAADHEALVLEKGLKGIDFVELSAICNVIAHGGSEKHEKPLLKVARETIKKRGEAGAFFHAMGAVGTEDSRKLLEEWVDGNAHRRDDHAIYHLEGALQALQKLDKRLGVSSKPAEDALKEAIARVEARSNKMLVQ